MTAAAEPVLTTVIEEDQIVIRIPFAYLQTAADCAADAGLVTDHKVIDPASFAQAILGELETEKEDGTTMVHEMLDLAIRAAVENGAEGISEVEDEDSAPVPA